MRHMKIKLTNVFPFAAAIIFSLCFLSGFIGMAKAQQEAKWTAESHDRTNFLLVGKHRTVACGECHLNGVFEGTPQACEACHWERRNDDRYQLRLGAHCGDCHTPQSWKNVNPNKWNHEAVTGFRLEGTHRMLDCAECHGENGFKKLSLDCFACHEKDYREAKDPDHAAASFPTQCQICHRSSLAWKGAVYDHSQFPLKGKHKTASCSECHVSGQYQGVSSECVSCHLNDYNSTKDPDHKKANFPVDCVICHGSNAESWQNANFDHNQFWPLQGAHTNLDCQSCHSKGYNLPKDCYGCHADDYNKTTDPNHKAAGFPTACETCHYPAHTSWSQAVFQHDFPIKSGRHANFSCSDCHLTNNYREFSCIDCHAHQKADMDNAHSDVSGYSYNSQACYACHPRGTAG
jgi:hypothetical protein